MVNRKGKLSGRQYLACGFWRLLSFCRLIAGYSCVVRCILVAEGGGVPSVPDSLYSSKLFVTLVLNPHVPKPRPVLLKICTVVFEGGVTALVGLATHTSSSLVNNSHIIQQREPGDAHCTLLARPTCAMRVKPQPHSSYVKRSGIHC